MLQRTSQTQAIEFLKLHNNKQNINKSHRSVARSEIIQSGLNTGLPPLVSRSINHTSALSDILKHNPLTNKSKRLVIDNRASSLSLQLPHHYTLHNLKDNETHYHPQMVSLDAAMRTERANLIPGSTDAKNPMMTPLPSDTNKPLPPILTPQIDKISLRESFRSPDSYSRNEELKRNDSLPPVVRDFLLKKSRSPQQSQERTSKMQLIKQRFNDEFKKKFSPFLNHNSMKYVSNHKSHRVSRSMIESPQQFENMKVLRQQKKQIEEEEEMRRQAKLAEVKMRNNLLKNKDFRKILKNYLKKNTLNSPSPEIKDSEDSRSPSHQDLSYKRKGSFFVHSTLDRKLQSPSFIKIPKIRESQFKFLPPFPISINVDPVAIERNQQLTGKVKIAKKAEKKLDSSLYDTELSRLEQEGKVTQTEPSKPSPRGEDILKNQHLKGILKTGRKGEKSVKDLKLPRVTFKLEGVEGI